jgi:hypothetical protein
VGNIRGDLAGETCSPNILTASLTDANGAAVSISAMVDDLKFGTINWLDIRISLSLISTQGKTESQFLSSEQSSLKLFFNACKYIEEA